MISLGVSTSDKDLPDAMALALFGELKEPFDSTNPEHVTKAKGWKDKIRQEGFDPDLYHGCRKELEEWELKRSFTEADVEKYACFVHACWKNNNSVSYDESGRSHFQKGFFRCGIHHRFFVTDTGRVGMSPEEAQPGDIAAILFGAQVPFVLRPTKTGYLVVGSCYCYTAMEGQYVRDLKRRGNLQHNLLILNLQ